MIQFDVICGDVCQVPSDLLLLKHAQAFYGADKQAALALIGARCCTDRQLRPSPEHHALVATGGKIAPAQVLFLGTVPLGELDYRQMRRFARRALLTALDEEVSVRWLTATVHGVGIGLDAAEALEHLVAGFREGLAAWSDCPIQRITFVERNERTARILTQTLREIAALPEPAPSPAARTVSPAAVPAAVDQKEHVFVAMPFAEELQDVYEFGIYGPVRRCGYICERVDEAAFTGDILQRIKERIESAKVVIADLTGAKPNVYLEVGYAWGKGVPVIVLARKNEPLHFDVKTYNCLFYSTIGQLAKDLEKRIRDVFGPGAC
jgi:hypothetical protein